MLSTGNRVSVIALDDESLDGKVGTVIANPTDENPYWEISLDDPPNWVKRMFPGEGILLTENEVKVCG